MRIGQLAQLAGVDIQTIRFYERQGLLPPPNRQDNGYRTYKADHAERLLFIRRCRSFGMSLEEIGVLQSYQEQPQQPCTAINALLDTHITQVRAQIASLHALENQLVTLRSCCDNERQSLDCGILSGLLEGDKTLS
ncbi:MULTISPECIES: Cd(II)/Pb(II)-responsive transcriptional regulator [Pseudomonas]|jgi:Cd(II)/Pb(II)-responsive transcriptional regulator|uniref:Cd(II)/Pb(II)-responsive transcriptional regulator n=1 Tax=Pseudomonas lactis TaxID=1615674 RepID=A0A921T9K0_9PSED|nr:MULTISPECIES: Cd(II)/Pb(II)-responsive transcriptional regulator [Pseudomonas]MBK3433124.1 Cd(II)/Pb(II)-responsive transcriptional regulator [Pseudomonas fluorescens]MBA1203558.1 Cd(II)/Pb(II)-responsive transcriptional regulator [Pseudomonas capeferrum]MBK3483719.1 Cd(II)/Pb(II)-responsive transcriptional regulator [Pseudomonas fluorescens]MEB0194436.1 Cd(II)/Pb(II)-responsive transcriptional regulator [Pseudomonas sp. CCI1.1]OEC62225.1 Cd(II)/Pb(II)-responsive transcriptional regulator [